MNKYMKSSTSVNPLTNRYGQQASIFRVQEFLIQFPPAIPIQHQVKSRGEQTTR